MTVAELVAKLLTMPQDALVVLTNEEWDGDLDAELVEEHALVKFREDIPSPHPWSGFPLRTWRYYPDHHGWDREPYLGKFDRVTGVTIT